MGKEPIWTVGQQYAVIELTTATRLIFSGRCLLFGVLLSADGDSVRSRVFDGRTAQGKEVLHLEAIDETSVQWNCERGALMEKGIYVYVSASQAHLTVTYSPLEKKSFRGE